jgi:hypothetical protein
VHGQAANEPSTCYVLPKRLVIPSDVDFTIWILKP